ncbi:hypothetical protein TRFO_29005 [Tritrichomonas foetus]|uniref:Post-transcriptional regulator MKT1 C-terminal domain-containing protein n=1 Tax=Tritrichomonas foetus TaxID=1144522 RepID=A0A1J4JYM4_9EUKA|nr:hypothetical protein TRFO_29005 [Tritrichomonas foetus]|eukprot:OHT03576.1 hypothetical protein TRFO_29005 [Tritrichomonas foetus]
MLTFRSSSNALIHIPMYVAPLMPMKTIFHLGIDFSHFFNLYLSRFNNSTTVIPDMLNCLSSTVKDFRSFNIEPVFVFVGISYHQVDCSHSNLESEIEDLLRRLKVAFVRSPSTGNAQLSALLKLKCVNAIMCSPSIVLRDVSRWIHFIDFKLNKILLLKGSISTMKGIISPRMIYEISAPSFSFDRIMWNLNPPFNDPLAFQNVPDIVIALISSGYIHAPRLATYPQNASRKPLFPLPRNCINHLNILCGIYFSLFLHLSELPFSRILNNPESPPYDEFLPLLLAQNSISEPCQLNNTLISQILAQQNISSTRFTTLFDCLRAVSPPKKAESPEEMTPEFVISESVRRFLTSHEYIAPGGGLSPWGRAILVANTGLDMSSILFIEMVRADAMDSNFDSSFGSVSITDLIERTFSLFPTETEVPEEFCESHLGYFSPAAHIVSHVILSVMKLIICETYISVSKQPDLNELTVILDKLPFTSFKEHSTGILMRFLLESPDEKRKAFIQSVPRKQLKKDVNNAISWWKSLNKATVELKQRSLKPNSRVSNLKNFLVMFECANHFVEKTIDDVLRIL